MSTPAVSNPDAEPVTQNARAGVELRADLPLEVAQLIAAYQVQGRKLSPSRARRLLAEQAAVRPNPWARHYVKGERRPDTPRALIVRADPSAERADKAIGEAWR